MTSLVLVSEMPRSKDGKKRNPVDKQKLEQAIHEVLKGTSINECSNIYKIGRWTISRHLNKFKQQDSNNNFEYTNNCGHRKVFTDEEENDLVNYLLLASRIYFGITKEGLSTLAFEYASQNGKKFPESWQKNAKAGKQWVQDFLTRHREKLSLRKPQATSIGRAMCFNRPIVEAFYNNLQKLFNKYKFSPDRIFNLDETGLSTVHNPPKVIAGKGEKQVGAITSAERGTLITLISSISAIGSSIPPLLIFPRVNFKEFMLHGAPPGSTGAANTSGWTNAHIFLTYLEHFKKHVRPSKEQPVLIILDNHDSHLSLEAIEFSRKNGIVIFTLPPHTSHKLQPLDKGVFGPLKTYYHQECSLWMTNNPGKPISIYEVSSLLGKSYPRAFTPTNIIAGFKATGVFPLDPNVYSDDDFLSATPTDLFDENHIIFSSPKIQITDNTQSKNVNAPNQHENSACVSPDRVPQPSSPQPSCSYVSPIEVRPLPRAPTQQNGTKRRGRLGKSRVITDTPEKEDLQQAVEARKRPQKLTEKDKPAKKLNFGKICKQKSGKKDSSEDESENWKSADEEEDENLEDLASEMIKEQEDDEISEEWIVGKWDFTNPSTNVDKWVLVSFSTQNLAKFYVGQVLEASCDQVTIKFLRKKQKMFRWPDIDDVCRVRVEDIIRILPQPKVHRRGGIQFNISFAGFNLY